MNSPARKTKEYPGILSARVSDDKITALLSDGREISIPLSWFPRLFQALPAQRSKFQISPAGYGIHWPEIDEDISIKAFLGELTE
jgi:hypothetical protein